MSSDVSNDSLNLARTTERCATTDVVFRSITTLVDMYKRAAERFMNI
jgi:hypothetical protein